MSELTHLIDLASSRLGGEAVAANDEFFAEKGKLLKPEPAVFIPDKYTAPGTGRGRAPRPTSSARKRRTCSSPSRRCSFPTSTPIAASGWTAGKRAAAARPA